MSYVETSPDVSLVRGPIGCVPMCEPPVRLYVRDPGRDQVRHPVITE